MVKFLKGVTVIGCTVAGGAFGWLMCKALWGIYNLPIFSHGSPGPAKSGGFGDMMEFLVRLGFDLGVLFGVCVTLGAVGGLLAGLALARRIKPPVPVSPQPRAV